MTLSSDSNCSESDFAASVEAGDGAASPGVGSECVGRLTPFGTEPVPDAVVERVIAEGLRTISPKASMAPHFVIIRTPAIREKLTALIREETVRRNPVVRVLTRMIPRFGRHLQIQLDRCPTLARWTEAPVVLLISRQENGADADDLSKLIHRVLLAAQVFGLQAFRLDGLPKLINHSRAIRLLLGFPTSLTIVDTIALGYPATADAAGSTAPVVRGACTWV